jgi:hypothetical protein
MLYLAVVEIIVDGNNCIQIQKFKWCLVHSASTVMTQTNCVIDFMTFVDGLEFLFFILGIFFDDFDNTVSKKRK